VVECGSRAGGVRLASFNFSAVSTSAELLSSLLISIIFRRNSTF
jgi:hypothetical protein